MPSGRVHDIITTGTTPIIGFVGYKIVDDYKMVVILLAAYLFSSLMFNGDLDIKSSPYRRWLILRIIWKPYQMIFEHRSIWTHGIIIGTVIRLLWISPLIAIILTSTPLSLATIGWTNIFLILIGFELGNTVHTISDKIVSALL